MKHITTTDSSIVRASALDMLQGWYLRQPKGRAPTTRGLPQQTTSPSSQDVQLDTTRWVVRRFPQEGGWNNFRKWWSRMYESL